MDESLKESLQDFLSKLSKNLVVSLKAIYLPGKQNMPRIAAKISNGIPRYILEIIAEWILKNKSGIIPTKIREAIPS